MGPSKETPWFAFHPDGKFHWFATEGLAVAWADADMQDWLIQNDLEWPDGIDQYLVGKVSHDVEPFDRREKPPVEDLDEYDCAEDGTDWGHVDYICNYRMVALDDRAGN